RCPGQAGMRRVSGVAAAALPALGTATGVAETAPPARRWDPRIYQIATLSGLLGYGVLWLDLEVQAWTAVAIIVTALSTQLACTWLTGRGRFDPRSALISALSLCLLLRTGSLGLAMLTAAVAIASKFTLRVRDAARPVGQRTRHLVPAGLSRRTRRQPRRARRRHAGLPGLLGKPARGPLALARRAARDPPAPPERAGHEQACPAGQEGQRD